MATIREVARKAGVAPSTVSLVLRGGDNVADDTRDLVARAISELQYSPRKAGRPRGAAPEGRRNRKHQIGFIAPLNVADFRSAAVYMSVMHGIEMAAAQYGQSILMRHVTDQNALPNNFVSKLDGLIILAPHMIAETRIPQVRVMGVKIPGETIDHVTYNNNVIGYLAADYLLSRGHKTCAFLSPRAGQEHKEWFDIHDVNRDRLGHFEERIRSAGGTVRTNTWSVPGWLPYSPDKMTQLLKDLLLTEPRPTGLFIPADGLTGPAYALLQAAGIRPGIDVDIVSCNNDLPVLSGLHPRPGVVDIHATDVGSKGLAQLLWRIENPNAPVMQIMLNCEIIPSSEAYKGTPR